MIPNIFELHEVLFNEENCKKFLMNNNILRNNVKCEYCQKPLFKRIKQGLWICVNRISFDITQ